MLQVSEIETFYGRSQVLFGVSLEVLVREAVTLMGRNGMGKTTLVRSIFGLTPPFIGRGYGGPLLDSAVQNAFAWGADRVWVHTCNYDHPNALNNYLKSGFQIFKVEEKP